MLFFLFFLLYLFSSYIGLHSSKDLFSMEVLKHFTGQFEELMIQETLLKNAGFWLVILYPR